MEFENRGDLHLPSISSGIVAVDLGEMTGIARYEFSSSKLFCDSTENPVDVILIVQLYSPCRLLLERFPKYRDIGYELERVYGMLSETALLISPGAWKPFMKVRKRKFPQAKNRHERDAVNILRYYLLLNAGKDVA